MLSWEKGKLPPPKELCSFSRVRFSPRWALCSSGFGRLANTGSSEGGRDPGPSFCLTTAGVLQLASQLRCKSDCISIKALKCNLALKARM